MDGANLFEALVNKCLGYYREIERKLSEVEMELASAKSQGFMRKWVNLRNANSTSRSPLLAVIGINTEFGNRLKRDKIRSKWMPRGF